MEGQGGGCSGQGGRRVPTKREIEVTERELDSRRIPGFMAAMDGAEKAEGKQGSGLRRSAWASSGL